MPRPTVTSGGPIRDQTPLRRDEIHDRLLWLAGVVDLHERPLTRELARARTRPEVWWRPPRWRGAAPSGVTVARGGTQRSDPAT
jgi:hypothetical protein